MESPSERQEATAAHLGDTDTGSSYLGSSFYHVDAGLVSTSWNSPSNLLASGPSPASTHQPEGTSTGTPQAKQLTRWGHSPTHQQIGCLKTLEPTTAPGHSLVHQRVQDPATHASAQALDPGTPGPCSQRPHAPAPHTSEQAPAPESPGP